MNLNPYQERTRRAHPAIAGFSLIEFGALLVLVALIGGLILPYTYGWLAKARVLSSAEEIANAFRLAQVEAISRSAQVEVVFVDEVPSAAAVIPSASGRKWVLLVGTATPSLSSEIANGELGPGVSIWVSQPRVTFGPAGRLSDEIDVIAEVRPSTGDARPLRVTVARTGGIRLCDPGLVATDFRAC